MLIDSDIYEKLKKEATAAYPKEGCGMLLGIAEKFLVTQFQVLENTASPDRTDRHFSVDPLTVYETEKKAAEVGLDVLGFFHTHPDHDAVLSEEDKAYMIPGMLYMILSVADGKVRISRIYEKKSAEGPAAEIEFWPVTDPLLN